MKVLLGERRDAAEALDLQRLGEVRIHVLKRVAEAHVRLREWVGWGRSRLTVSRK